MSKYDVDLVKKFASLNKERIEKTAKINPEIGNLIKQIIASMIEEEPKSISPNERIYQFLLNEGADGFFSNEWGVWYSVNTITRDEIILQDSSEKNYTVIEYENLLYKLGERLIPTGKPKFEVGETVIISNDSLPENGKEGEILKISKNNADEPYKYFIDLSPALSTIKENDLLKVGLKPAKVIKPKQTVNANPTPVEIEISNMTQDQLLNLKSEIEETMMYLEDGDQEKNDLEIQLELVNLYLEN